VGISKWSGGYQQTVQNQAFLCIMLASIEVVNMSHPTLSHQRSEIDNTQFSALQGLPHVEPVAEQGLINRFELDQQLQALMRFGLPCKRWAPLLAGLSIHWRMMPTTIHLC
jgi:hypothetical protein